MYNIRVGTGSLWSPGFDLGYHYFNNLDCTWDLLCDQDLFIHVRFADFSLEYEFSCIFDYVELLDTYGTFGR